MRALGFQIQALAAICLVVMGSGLGRAADETKVAEWYDTIIPHAEFDAVGWGKAQEELMRLLDVNDHPLFPKIVQLGEFVTVKTPGKASGTVVSVDFRLAPLIEDKSVKIKSNNQSWANLAQDVCKQLGVEMVFKDGVAIVGSHERVGRFARSFHPNDQMDAHLNFNGTINGAWQGFSVSDLDGEDVADMASEILEKTQPQWPYAVKNLINRRPSFVLNAMRAPASMLLAVYAADAELPVKDCFSIIPRGEWKAKAK